MVPTVSSSRAAEAAVTYREQAPPPELAPWVRCLWELTVQGDGGPGRVVPDGFMDLVASGPELTLAGPDTRPWPVRGGPAQSPSGSGSTRARLRPCSARPPPSCATPG